jgi:DNA polymerase-3 subunit delta'
MSTPITPLQIAFANPPRLCYNDRMNWQMFGHEWAVAMLREHILQGRPRHAYLFTGPRGIGRRTLALHLAQALNCPQPITPGEPCQTCRICIQIERMQHPDLSVVQAERVGGVIKVEQVRELQRSLSLAPYQARYRVAIILRFEEANANAANALLKTLEEPQPQVVLVLTAESAESLLPTIASRCEILRLRPLNTDAIQQGLQSKWNIPEKEAELLAHLSGGRVGYALRLHQDSDLMAFRQSILERHRQMLSADRVRRFAEAEQLSKDKDSLRQTIEIWQSLWRDVYLHASGSEVPIANLDRRPEIEDLARHVGSDGAYQMVTSLQSAGIRLDENVNTRLTVEVLFLDLPRISARQP